MTETMTPNLIQEAKSTGMYALDPSHSTVEFSVKNLFGLATVRGHFGRFHAELEVPDGKPESARVRGEAETASLDTKNTLRDAHLRAKAFFWVDSHPAIRYQSTAVRALDADRYEVEGLLTVRGVTVPLTVQAHLKEADAGRVVVTAHGDTDRYAYGLHSARGMVGASVHIEIEATFVTQPEARWPHVIEQGEEMLMTATSDNPALREVRNGN